MDLVLHVPTISLGQVPCAVAKAARPARPAREYFMMFCCDCEDGKKQLLCRVWCGTADWCLSVTVRALGVWQGAGVAMPSPNRRR